MRVRYCADEVDEFKYRRAMKDAEEDQIMAAARKDILNGRLDTLEVQEALQLGHHRDYLELKSLYDDAVRAARHSRGTQ